MIFAPKVIAKEVQTMRLIDADALYEEHTRLAYEGDYAFHITARAWLEKQPTVDAVPVRHGRWIKNDNETWSCERCHSWIPDEQHYYARFCLYCGAKMDGGADDVVD